MTRIAILLFALFAIVSPAAAQSTAGASATVEVRRSLTVSTARPMTPSGDPDAALSTAAEDGIYQITGDPNRVYRVRIEGATGEAATRSVIESRNAGDISDGGLGRLDSEGRDTLRITPRGQSGDAAQPPPGALAIDYE